MINRRDAVKASLTVIVGGKAGKPTPPPPTLRGWLTYQNRETGEMGGYGQVDVIPRPDGSYLVRPVRSGADEWRDR